MDRWTLIITGGGAHHTGHDTDVDALAAEFIEKLRASGQMAFGSMTAAGMSFDLEPAPKAPEAPVLEAPKDKQSKKD